MCVGLTFRVTLLVVGIAIPILATLLSFLFPTLIIKLKPFLVYPALFGYKYQTPFARYLHFPNLGQTTYIVLFIILNIVLTAVDYHSIQPSTWYATRPQEICSKVAARTGVIAMALAPLTFLFAGRNNVLLWLTNWDHGTYILLHRWIARLFNLHVVIHSIGELWAYVDNGSYATNLPQAWWIWGCVATVAAVAMCVKSVFRIWKYELFLLLHIVLAVFVLVGTWYHLIYRFDYQWGYHYMLYACFGVWAFDRILRIVLLARNGYRTATLTSLGPITRVDISGTVPMDNAGTHGYVYFPVVRKWAPWENNPFSVIPSHLLQPQAPLSSSTSAGSSSGHLDTPSNEKALQLGTPLSVRQPGSPNGITFYVKSHSGLTRQLHSVASATGTTRALVEGPYGHQSGITCDRLITIAGGVGITATLPYFATHHQSKLYWSVKMPMQPLVDDITSSALFHSDKEREVKVGGRFDMKEIIEIESATCKGVLGVVVCGPAGMCDDARKAVVELGRKGKKIEMMIEAFSW